MMKRVNLKTLKLRHMNIKTIDITDMEKNKEVTQDQPKKTGFLKKAAAVVTGVVLGAVAFAGITNYKGCRTATVKFIKGIKFPWNKTTEVKDEVPQTEPTQAREYRQYNNYRRDYQKDYQKNRRPQWN